MSNKINKFVFWIPRILSILFILFLALMSLDVISSELSLMQIFLGMLMHNIPTFILIIVLIIAWKREIVGAVVFLLAGLFYVFMVMRSSVDIYTGFSWSLTIAGPAFLIGILFLINWLKKIK